MIFKKFLIALLLLSGMSSYAADLNIAVISLEQIAQQAPQRDAILEKLKSEFKDRIDDMTAKGKNIQELQQKMERDKLTMSMKESTEITRKIEELSVDYRLKGKQLQEDQRRRENEELRELMETVNGAVSDYAKKKKIDMVISKRALIFASDKAPDITEKVIAVLKKK